MVQYYVPFWSHEAAVGNLHLVPLLLHMRWYGQPSGSDVHLCVSHLESKRYGANKVLSKFHKVLWDDVEDSEKSPCRKARLRLEGKLNGEDIFAILEFDMNSPGTTSRITFSPVPFGLNGKPRLPYRDDKQFALFLQITRIVLDAPGGMVWNDKILAKEVHKRISVPEWEFYDSNASFFLGELEKLRVIRRIDNVRYSYEKSFATGLQFEEIFGVKLPDAKVG